MATSNGQSSMLQPRFYREFSCIGPDCEHHCCQNWQISLNKRTFKSYSKSSDIKLREFANTQTARPRQVSDSNYRQVKLNAEGICPMQNQDGSCHIHCNHGEELLSTDL